MSDDKPIKRPTMKQEKFIEAYVENGGNATEAALVAYDCNNKVEAGNIGYQNMKKDHIQDLIASKVKELKDSTIDKIKKHDLMGLALDTAHSDLMDDDPKVRESARKYILEVSKFLSDQEKAPNGPKHNHLHLPGWKG